MPRQALITFFTFVGVFLFFAPVQAAIVVNEIAAFESSGCEWIELLNTGPEAVNMEGWRFWEQNVNHGLTVGASSAAQDWVVEPGEYAIIAQNDADLFSSACGDYTHPVGTVFDSSWGSLNESGELIGLKDADGNFIEQFSYIAAPNFSLERTDATLAEYMSTNWTEHASGHTFGLRNDASQSSAPPPPPPPPPPEPEASPQPEAGTAPQAGAPTAQRIVINEFISDPNTGEREWVELYNTEDIAGDITGWLLRDGVQEIASLSGVISAKGFLVVELSGSKLNNDGDAVQLESPARGVVDRVSFGDWTDGEDANMDDNAGAPEKGNAVARLIDGYDTGVDSNNFLETTTPTKDATNRILSPAELMPPPPPPPVAIDPSPSLPATQGETPTELPPAPLPVIHITAEPKPAPKEKPKAGKETKKKETKKAPARAAFEGVVSAEPGVLGTQYFYIAFPSPLASDISGLQVYLHNKDFPKLSRGDVVRVAGILGTAYGEARLKLASRGDIEILESEEESLAPMPLALSDIPENGVGAVFDVEGEVTEAKRGQFFLDDGEEEIQVTIRERTGVDLSPKVGERFRVRGILHRKSGDAWEILVRDAADMERLEESADRIAEPQAEKKTGVLTVAASGAASFLLGLLARTRGAFLLAGIKSFRKNKLPPPSSMNGPTAGGGTS